MVGSARRRADAVLFVRVGHDDLLRFPFASTVASSAGESTTGKRVRLYAGISCSTRLTLSVALGKRSAFFSSIRRRRISTEALSARETASTRDVTNFYVVVTQVELLKQDTAPSRAMLITFKKAKQSTALRKVTQHTITTIACVQLRRRK